jgi:deoxyribonuclease-4
MPLFGAHMSIAGGYYKALEAAQALGMEACQLFTKNNNQWRAKPITDEEVKLFQGTLARTGIRYTIAHASYLINLASASKPLFRRSVDAMVEEMRRAAALGLDALVVHPGAAVDATEEDALARIVTAMDEVLERSPRNRVRLLLETTAGQGTCLGHRFEHLAGILGSVKQSKRVGVCLDTCHVFAAGYALSPAPAYRATLREFDRVIGLERLEAFHLNDSLRPLGSRVDRHAHIGQGHLGLEPFRLLVRDRRFRKMPMLLETPKENDDCDTWDAINLATLRGLAS